MAVPNFQTVQWRDGANLIVFDNYIFITSGQAKANVRNNLK